MNNYEQVIVLLVLIFVAIRVDCITPTNKFEEGLLKLIERGRNGDVQGLPVAIPSLKPLTIPSMKFDYGGCKMSVSDIKVKGLENLSVEKLSASPENMTISIDLFIPTLGIRADRYRLKGTIMYVFTMDDKGILKANANNLRAQAVVKFGAEGKDTVVKHLKLDYTVQNIQVQLGGSSDTVNDFANEMVSDLITSSKTKRQLQNVIKDQANELLRGHTPQEFITIVSSM
ncbi:uncharacterized protein LOC125240718 [Leguminivora glycinivorella]|uniref:uncharacterized protein LOC125240718 n=1 Tax=Leguminivora glycinivorella TaxID=1035111 RepID=UPI00200E9C8E|nr:uncharacterized protein LOC125240718 [Leguminivora glycinivorella]